MKRLLDILVSGTALILLLPVILPICVILRFAGQRRVFFRQERIGYGGTPFQLIKFTTMMDSVANRPPGSIVFDSDPEVFWIGRILRRSKLNEIPQLINVLRGEMSLVGPRPLTPRSFGLYSEHTQELLKHVKPGLTGIGSLVFRNEESILAKSTKSREECYRTEIRPYKAALEKWYSANRTLWVDMKILAATAWAVIFPHSQCHERLFRDLPPSSK